MSAIRKAYGEQALLALITIMLKDLVDFFNVGKSMSVSQTVQTARLIADDYYYLNVDDFRFCFDNAKRGRYGKVYDRIDGNVIYEWLDKYAEERFRVAYPEGSQEKQIETSGRLSKGKDTKSENFRMSCIVEKIKNKIL